MLQILGRLILVIDNKEQARQFMEAIPHAKELGIWFATIGQGTVEMHMNYDERFIGDPKTGVTHGGAVLHCWTHVVVLLLLAILIKKD